jgi:hypothetical protein
MKLIISGGMNFKNGNWPDAIANVMSAACVSCFDVFVGA